MTYLAFFLNFSLRTVTLSWQDTTLSFLLLLDIHVCILPLLRKPTRVHTATTSVTNTPGD